MVKVDLNRLTVLHLKPLDVNRVPLLQLIRSLEIEYDVNLISFKELFTEDEIKQSSERIKYNQITDSRMDTTLYKKYIINLNA